MTYFLISSEDFTKKHIFLILVGGEEINYLFGYIISFTLKK
jgi:hypothetical protein